MFFLKKYKNKYKLIFVKSILVSPWYGKLLLVSNGWIDLRNSTTQVMKYEIHCNNIIICPDYANEEPTNENTKTFGFVNISP